jgi:hypothetical protein
LAKDEGTARATTRELLRLLHDGLGQPPLHFHHRAAIVAVLDVLGELGLERRFQVRERVAELLAEGGERP